MENSVEYKREKIPIECDLLKQSALFSDIEIREIAKTRNGLDYKIDNQLKSVRDFLEYIKYERELLSLINEKRKIIGAGEQKKILEQSVAGKIIRLYKQAIAKYPRECRLWENFVKFCKICKLTSEIQPYLTKWTTHHGDKPEVWIQVINYEYYEQQNIDKTRNFFTQALKIHPKSKELCITVFRIELNEAAQQAATIPKTEPGTDSVPMPQLNNLFLSKRAEIIYDHCKREICEIEYFIELLNISENYNFTIQLQNMIVLDLMNQFPGHELTWNTLAQRELKGYHINDIYSKDINISSFDTHRENQTQLTSKKRIELCVKIYSTAASIMKTQTMWSHYIDAMIDLNNNKSTQQNLKQNCLLTAYEGAHEAKCLSELQYLQYIELLKSCSKEEYEQKLCDVLQNSTEVYSNSIELWKLYLKHYMQKDDENKVYDIFAVASKIIGTESLPLWELLKQYFLIKFTHENRKKTENIFKEAIKQPEPIGSVFKSHYLEWMALIKGMDACRSLFRDLVKYRPPSYKLHRKMMQLNNQLLSNERNKLNDEYINDINETKFVYEISIELFGASEPDIWLDYIRFERDYGEIKNMNVLFEKAKLVLKPHLLDNFISQYELVVNLL